MKIKKIASYNVNGIRAVIEKGFIAWLKEVDFDVICLQEIKAFPDQFNTKEFDDLGYHCYWNPAQKKGYSGTAILSKQPADQVRYGIGNDFFDDEGRLLRVDWGDVTLVCAYFPSGSSGDERQDVKMDFLVKINEYLANLMIERPNIILTGDFNICKTAIDINNPKKHLKTSGFLPEEQKWFADFVQLGWVDTFREYCAEPEKYTWWSYRSRAKEKNLGWRIDYFMITESLKHRLSGAGILPEVVFSDHCPISIDISIEESSLGS